ncbi:Hcp family type VI secretion system effector [Mixta gaviniae]|uniref:Type VI secretion system tube protein Hcp n=1 Tax=Mixta gaviniae TaxID=665914 RepID=A0A2L0IIL3_9GAMM|nr:type VI secretion system tube protein Hcp [Mixta gaviniae]AUX94339.1 type VI secretion system tube protein Hcp [Mixta gaviniae]
MSIDLFLKIDGIQGEAKDANHKGWITLSGFNWGASQPGNMQTGGGGGAGRVTWRDLMVNAPVDRATPAVAHYLAAGRHINKVELSACKAGDPQIEYMRITLEEVILTNVSYSGAAGAVQINMAYHFQAASVRQQYWEQTESGGKGAEAASGWNIKENKAL